MLKPTKILKKLKLLKRLDPERRIFGADYHNYQLNPCLDERAVRTVERRYAIRLPDDYRRFLREVGNGGAGPYYGMSSLNEQDSGWETCNSEDGFLVGDPSALFRYQDRWNLSETTWANMPDHKMMSEDEYARACDEWDAELEKSYWDQSVMNGAIPICHLGCALRQWLVFTGPERGNIWGDDRADYKGVYPLLTPEDDRVTFADWYMNWLDESLSKIGHG